MEREVPNEENKLDTLINKIKETGQKGLEKGKSASLRAIEVVKDPHFKENMKGKIVEAYDKTKDVNL